MVGGGGVFFFSLRKLSQNGRRFFSGETRRFVSPTAPHAPLRTNGRARRARAVSVSDKITRFCGFICAWGGFLSTKESCDLSDSDILCLSVRMRGGGGEACVGVIAKDQGKGELVISDYMCCCCRDRNVNTAACTERWVSGIFNWIYMCLCVLSQLGHDMIQYVCLYAGCPHVLSIKATVWTVVVRGVCYLISLCVYIR